MTTDKGRDLFIVDNSRDGWTGLRYLDEWCAISESFDIATGFFEIGALLALDGKWQGLKKIRVLMGAEMTYRTRNTLLDAVRTEATKKLNSSVEDEKYNQPLLERVPAIVEALQSGQIECRIYDKDKFHAKAYITHAKLEVVGSQALVGSSNFTRPGLTTNIELNVQIQSAREVAQLQDWFEDNWSEATEVNDAVITTISRHTHLHTPFDVYAKALQELFRGHEMTDREWDETTSKMYSHLDRYQQEAYRTLIKISRQYGGAFLCDGVGLGKTFVGLMLIERLILHDAKRVVLFAPKATKEAVWEPHIRDWLPHIGGVSGSSDFSNLAVFSHTDLVRKGDFPERFARMTELADVVVIDEAHHFRNPGRPGNAEEDIEPSRYYRLYEILDNAVRSKTVYMLTATPINNRLSDFRHLAELFTRQEDTYFASTLGVNSLRNHFNTLERKTLSDMSGLDTNDYTAETQQLQHTDDIISNLVVQRSRAYAKKSQILEVGKTSIFPERSAPTVADYSIRQSYGRLLDRVEEAFEKQDPLFVLPMYYPLKWYIGPDPELDPLVQGRQKQVVGLIRTTFLKRFESSVKAFEMSCTRLLQKLLAFVEKNSTLESERSILARWKKRNNDVLKARERQLELWGSDDDEDAEEDIVPQELLQSIEELDRKDYDVGAMLDETFQDLETLVGFFKELSKFTPNQDDKLKKLIRLLKTKELTGQKILLFTEFAETARYLKTELQKQDIDGIEQVDSQRKLNRAEVIKAFAPYYNGTSSQELVDKGTPEIRVLISTDVLSEGLNLQDASYMINYDIHWNPVRLMQRIGRVDRRMNPEVERRLIADHPEIKSSRGKVKYWNFLPPGELNAILTLYTKVTQKTLLISETLGIEGKQLLTPGDHFKALKEFNALYEQNVTTVEQMHLDFQQLLKDDVDLEQRLTELPNTIFSGRKRVTAGSRGVFFCYTLPALDKEQGEFTDDAGTTRWYLYDIDREDGGNILDEAGVIIESIRSKPKTPRRCTIKAETFLDVRKKVERHIKNTYMKRVNAPADVRPKLRCWMDLNET